MCHHKTPHRPWEPDDKHADLYADNDLPYPDTFGDDYSETARAAAAAAMRVEADMTYQDLKLAVPPGRQPRDKIPVPDDLEGFSLAPTGKEPVTFSSLGELKRWKYQRYMKDYLRCVASIDDNVGRLLGVLETPVCPDWSPEWELFDLEQDPCEMRSVYHEPDYASVLRELKGEPHRLQHQVGDSPCDESE